ncbi:MAG: hypothetical protein OWU33_12215 [Firmicutes bacterium]|nr:hypothetical protein [Bacillota bacterium]
MRGRYHAVPYPLRILGSLIVVVLPWVLVAAATTHRLSTMPFFQTLLVFLLATIAAQVGLIVRRWGSIRITALVTNAVLSIVAAAAYGVVTMLALRRGGGPVHPGVVALFTAYLLAVWSGHHD